MKCYVRNVESLSGKVTVPFDKSISHRAAILSALSEGKCIVRGYSQSQDCASTLRCIQKLGVKVYSKDETLEIVGAGAKGFSAKGITLDAGNSATTMRLLSGALASMEGVEITFTGDESLLRRPMMRIIEPLNLMGAKIIASGDSGIPPLKVKGAKLKGIDYSPPVASAQVKSAILIAGLRAEGKTVVREKVKTRDHTERMLRHMGAKIIVDGNKVTVEPSVLKPAEIEVPGDFSSAAFFISAALITPGSEIEISDVGLNPTRTGFLSLVERMNGRCTLEISNPEYFEPTGSIKASHSNLKAVEIGPEDVAKSIDEIPLLALLASQAEGTTRIWGAGELRHKESDRISVTVEGLKRMGARIEETPDGMLIRGPSKLNGCEVFPHKDHRLAMMFAVAALVAKGTTVINDWEWTRVSFPDFESRFSPLGVEVETL